MLARRHTCCPQPQTFEHTVKPKAIEQFQSDTQLQILVPFLCFKTTWPVVPMYPSVWTFTPSTRIDGVVRVVSMFLATILWLMHLPTIHSRCSFLKTGFVFNVLNFLREHLTDSFQCITVPPRTFEDQAAIFGPEMDSVYSGAIIYEWIQEANGYGLIQYGPPADPSVNEGSSVVQGYVH